MYPGLWKSGVTSQTSTKFSVPVVDQPNHGSLSPDNDALKLSFQGLKACQRYSAATMPLLNRPSKQENGGSVAAPPVALLLTTLLLPLSERLSPKTNRLLRELILASADEGRWVVQATTDAAPSLHSFS